MPNLMVALPNIGGALCSTPQGLADVHYLTAVHSNAAKTRNPLKLAGVPQTTGSISAASRPKFTILWGRLEQILLLNTFLQRSAMLALKRCTSYSNSVCLTVYLFVCPSVTRRYCAKTTARSMVQFALSDSKMCPVL